MSDDYAEYLEASRTPSEEFEELYGFPHECHCAEDWNSGACGVVSECFMGLADDALTQCHKYKGELADRERKMGMLRTQIASTGETPIV